MSEKEVVAHLPSSSLSAHVIDLQSLGHGLISYSKVS